MNYSISLILFILAVIHHGLKFDWLSILLLLIATIPILKKEYQSFINDCIYIFQRFSRIKLGSIELQFQPIQEITRSLREDGFLDQHINVKLDTSSDDLYFDGQNPIDALQKFRSDIEERLAKLARKYSLEDQSSNDLIDNLSALKIFKKSDQDILKKIIKLNIDESLLQHKQEILNWVNCIGKQLIEMLDNWAGDTRFCIGIWEDSGQPHPIDLDYKKIDTSDFKQLELMENEVLFSSKWREQQKALLKALSDSSLNDSTKNVITENQKLWEEYQKSFDNILQKVDFSSSGSIMPFLIAQHEHHKERGRTLELEQIRKWFLDITS
jgi:hypothetical protein